MQCLSEAAFRLQSEVIGTEEFGGMGMEMRWVEERREKKGNWEKEGEG